MASLGGGEDQITVVPHLDAEVVRADPKQFLGYSDNAHESEAVFPISRWWRTRKCSACCMQ